MIKLKITKEQYNLLSSLPWEERIVQVGNKTCRVQTLSEDYIIVHEYLPSVVIGKFREERDQQYKDTQELTPYE